MIQKPLGKVLVDGGYINNYQLSEALIKQKANPSLKIGDALVQLGHITQEKLQEALKKQTELAQKAQKTETPYQLPGQEISLPIENKELAALVRLLIKKRFFTYKEILEELKGG
ncbi:MAG: hypothetical protein HY097_11585 [Nitrospinae bacterium]|nr:hypothetical protein [Nitrospinota bacterium]